MSLRISHPGRSVEGTITLDGSKSLSNRLLIIRALSGQDFPILRLSGSKDTETLQKLLAQKGETFDAGAAGTTFRFMTAYLALKPGTQVLTGSERMKQRPIGALVEALRSLGAGIDYIKKDGYPPLHIHAFAASGRPVYQLSVPANISSQYISALLMIAPFLPQGLELTLEGSIVSRPYIEMTLNLMQRFGVGHEWQGHTIYIAPQRYQPIETIVEADWSAASYYYAIAAFADEVDLHLNGLFKDSLQGDAVVAEIMRQFGVRTDFTPEGIHLTKSGAPATDFFEWDFIRCPDIAQTMAVVCGGLGVQGLFTGLETLFIKETDRVAALKTELAKIGVSLYKLPARFSKKNDKQWYSVEGKATFDQTPRFETYEDHRMAMAFAPLALFAPIEIMDPDVVVKSYPAFWNDLKKTGFTV